MHNLFIFILASVCIMMFFVRRDVKIGLLFFSCICLYEYKLPVIFGSCVQIVPICFFISEIRSTLRLIRSNKSGLFHTLLILFIIYIILSVINSPYLQIGRAPVSFTIDYLFSRYLLLLASLICVNTKSDIVSIFKAVFYSVIIMTSFALSNFIFMHSYYVDWLFNGQEVVDYLEDAGAMYQNTSRFRVQGTFHNPFDYGYTCLACLLLFMYGKTLGAVSGWRYKIVLFCSLFGIITCGCRSVLLTFIASLLIYCYLYYNIKRSFFYTSSCVILFFILSDFIPQIDSIYNSLLSIFLRDSQIEGSSVDMRLLQIVSVFGYIENNLMFGRGIGFFANDLGFSEGRSGLIDKSLFGMEGSYLISLLETGLFGTILYFSIIAIFLYWSFHIRNINKSCSSTLFALYFAFLLFGILTGELRSAFITYLIAGLVIRNYKYKLL